MEVESCITGINLRGKIRDSWILVLNSSQSWISVKNKGGTASFPSFRFLEPKIVSLNLVQPSPGRGVQWFFIKGIQSRQANIMPTFRTSWSLELNVVSLPSVGHCFLTHNYSRYPIVKTNYCEEVKKKKSAGIPVISYVKILSQLVSGCLLGYLRKLKG